MLKYDFFPQYFLKQDLRLQATPCNILLPYTHKHWSMFIFFVKEGNMFLLLLLLLFFDYQVNNT